MKISKIQVQPYRIKLKKPFITSLGAQSHAENVVVKIDTNEGITGYGECSPYPMINGESSETCVVVGKYLSKGLTGTDPIDLDGVHRIMDQVIFGHSSIKSAFDIAMHDIASQHAGEPLYRFLGGETNRTLVTDYTVSIGHPVDMAEDAGWIQDQGYPVIKVKLGGDPDQDIERIAQIRRRVGSEIPLRLDANQGWDAESAIRVLQYLNDAGIEFCEEPIPRWDFLNLRWVKDNSPIELMADESCGDHHDAKRLIQLHACQMFNIKLGKSSGIFKAMKIIALAEEHNMYLQVGGFVESRLGFTASAHLALATNQVKFCDFDTPLMFVEDPVVGGLIYGENGTLTLPDVPGLGARIDL